MHKPKALRVDNAAHTRINRLAAHYHVDAETIAEAAIMLMEITIFPPAGQSRPHVRAPRRIPSKPVPLGKILKDIFNANTT